MSELLELLNARSGIICATGAGGKKSVLFAIAARHGGRVAFTTTVHSLPPPPELGARVVIAPRERLARELAGHRTARLVAYACPGDKPRRFTGVPCADIEALHAAMGFDLTLVKADGARMRWIKAPAEGEPVLPEATATLIPVLSARALGEPLVGRIAHRVERVAALSGAEPGKPFSPAHAARLLASPEALLKAPAGATVVPVINMVDDPARQALALAAAEQALSLSSRFDRILLLRLNRPEPLVAVVAR